MNLDLLIKLVKLANNNPNENEANLAARKVCKLIAEGDYKFVNTKVSEPPLSPSGRYYYTDNPPSSIYDWFREYAYRAYDKNTRYRYAYDYEAYYQQTYREPEPKQPKSKREMKCNVCGNHYQTTFVGPEFNFTCGNCQWTKYREEQKENL